MSDSTRWLLGIDSLSPGASGVEFSFAHPIPGWAWALIVSGAMVLGVLAYRRLEGSRALRSVLGALRALLLIALVVLISGPRLSKANESEEKDWVLVLVDRSLSMTIPDATLGSDRIEREQQLRTALEASRATWGALGAERVVIWLGFDGGVFDLERGAGVGGQGALPTLSAPIGRKTDVDRALEHALRRGAARPLSGIVLLTDGRSVSEPGKQLMRRLESEKVPVFSVALGSAEALADVSVTKVESPRSAFVNDPVPVQAEVQRTPSPGAGGEDGRAIVELIDGPTGAVLDSKDVDFAGEGDSAGEAGASGTKRRVTLMPKSSTPGAANWRVRIRPGAGGSDMIGENNQSDMSIELVDRPLRVALFDGYPRWEYRYLASLLKREHSMSSVIMQLAPGRRYLQEGTIVLDAVPTTLKEWNEFDVIVMGDVTPSVFTGEQLEQIKQRVAIGGAGIVWIAGEAATPAAWRGTALADVLPMSAGEGGGGAGSGSVGAGSVETFAGPVLVRPTAQAERLGVLRLTDTPTDGAYWPTALTDQAAGWPLLYWMQRIEPKSLKPTAEVLATAYRAEEGPATGSPAVISMRFGAGRSIYVATDEIWRWRYGRGELLPERFWLQIIRLLGRESLTRSGRAAMIEVSPASAEVGQPVRISVTLLDQALVDSPPSSVQVRVVRAGRLASDPASGGAHLTTELMLTPEGGNGAGGAGGTGGTGGARTFSGTWVPDQPGRYRAEAPDPVLSPGVGGVLETAVEVWLADDELRQPQANHPMLERLSQATGGKLLAPEQMGQLAKLLPNRRVRVSGDPDIDTLWDSPLALLMVLGLLTAEWVGRRLVRLV